ncbi:MAG: hypothetical protein RQ723_12270 [Desulfuromonadales bacterium]|nr:hypothetical protein [Desulfuromonadales bacterium]
MGFLKQLFGGKDPVARIRQLAARQEWAELLGALRNLDRSGLSAEVLADVDRLADEAGDQLARLNLDEGDWAARNGERLKAREHYSLAGEQVRSTELRAQIEAAQLRLASGASGATDAAEATAGLGCGSSCGPTCGPQPLAPLADSPADLDEEERLDLLLATLPPELATMYRQADPTLRQAWLAAQDGDDDRAGTLLDQVAPGERTALFHAERGALLARRGDQRAAMRDLQQALALDPTLFPAFDTLVAVMAQANLLAPLKQLLTQTIAEQRFVPYCWARLAELHTRQGELPAALAAGLQAIELGESSADLKLLCAQLLEREQRFAEAEGLLRQLPAGGCGGGIHPLHAEFLLRRGRDLNKVLESFKGALRQERDNPRWPLRIAQTYLAKGWKKEAAAQIDILLSRADLSAELRSEVRATADRLA